MHAAGCAVKKSLRPAVRREIVKDMEVCYQLSARRACRGLGFPRSTHCYKSKQEPQTVLRIRLRDLARVRIGYGYRRLTILLRREGWKVNHKRIYRLYVEENLVMRQKPPRRRVSCLKRQAPVETKTRNECWSMDFMAEELYDGRRLRVFTLVDNHTRECLALKVGQRMRGKDVVDELEKVSAGRGLPNRIQLDNGPEFISKDVDFWAYWNKVELDFSRPGKPTDKPFAESFNGRFRQECLNTHWFISISDAREKIETWKQDYNRNRPHSSLGDMTPEEFSKQCTSPAVASLQPTKYMATA